jgi:hypothetical protein
MGATDARAIDHPHQDHDQGVPADMAIDQAIDQGAEASGDAIFALDAGSPGDTASDIPIIQVNDAGTPADAFQCTSAADCSTGQVCDMTSGQCVTCSDSATCASQYGDTYACATDTNLCIPVASCAPATTTLYVDNVMGSDHGTGSTQCPLGSLTMAEYVASAPASTVTDISMAAQTFNDVAPLNGGPSETFPITLRPGVTVTGTIDNSVKPAILTTIVETKADTCPDSQNGSCALYEGPGPGTLVQSLAVANLGTGGRGIVFDGTTTNAMMQVVFAANSTAVGAVVERRAVATFLEDVFGTTQAGANPQPIGILVQSGGQLAATAIYVGDYYDSTAMTDSPIPNVTGIELKDPGSTLTVGASRIYYNTEDGIDATDATTLKLTQTEIVRNSGDGILAKADTTGSSPTGSVQGSLVLLNGKSGIELVDTVLDLSGTSTSQNTFNGATLVNALAGVCERRGSTSTGGPAAIPATVNNWGACAAGATSGKTPTVVYSDTCAKADVSEPIICNPLGGPISYPCVESVPCFGVGP